MNAADHSDRDDVTDTGSDLFSIEPTRKAVEVAFVLRLVESLGRTGSSLLAATHSAQAGTFSRGAVDAELASMQHPIFKLMARSIERGIPERGGFGKFGEHPSRKS